MIRIGLYPTYFILYTYNIYLVAGSQLNKFQIIFIAELNRNIIGLCVRCANTHAHAHIFEMIAWVFCSYLKSEIGFCTMSAENTLTYTHTCQSNTNEKYINKQCVYWQLLLFILSFFLLTLFGFQASEHTLNMASVDCVKFCGKFEFNIDIDE